MGEGSQQSNDQRKKLLFIVNVDWFFVSHRLNIALAARAKNYEVHIATAITHQGDLLKSHGLIVHPLSLGRSDQGLWTVFREFAQMYRVCREVKPDLVHLVTIKPVLLGGLATRLAGVPAVVAAVSGLGFVFVSSGFKAKLRRWLVAAVYKWAFDHRNLRVIFQNVDDRDLVCRMTGLAPQRAVLIRGSGADLQIYRYTPIPEGEPLVILASRLLFDKGVREFIEAIRLLRSERVQGDPIRFALVGAPDPGNPSSISEAELAGWARDGVVELWGHREDMPQVLAAASVVVLPSYREGMPKVLIEASACGRAIVTTDIPGCRDVIEPGISGILVPPRDARALATAMAKLVGDRGLCASMGMAGRRLAERAYDVKQVVAEHLRIYRELLTYGA